MADIAAIRAELASRLQTLLSTAGTGSAYWQPNPTPPTLQVVGIGPVDYDYTFGRGGDTLTATIEGLAGHTDDRGAQILIDNWCDTSGSTSVKHGIETERPNQVTLGGLVSTCRVTGHDRPKIVDLVNQGGATVQMWSVEFTLEIIT